MTNNIRVFLWLAVALALWLNYSQWQIDYGVKPATSTETTTDATGASKPVDIGDVVPQVSQPAAGAPAATDAVPAVAPQAAAAGPDIESAKSNKIRVTTDVLVLDISLTGGTLVRAELPMYPVVKGEAARVVLFNTDSPTTNYVLRTGLASSDDPNGPSHLATFTAPGQDELRVPLSWTDGKGVTVTKTFVFKRSLYSIDLEYQITNGTQAPWHAVSYARIVRSDPAVKRSFITLNVESMATRGPAFGWRTATSAIGA